MSLQDLKNALEGHLSDTAEAVITSAIERFNVEEDGEPEEDDVQQAIYGEIDSAFIYTSDAFDYVQNYVGGNMSEAIDEGCQTIESIAAYYLQNEIEGAF